MKGLIFSLEIIIVLSLFLSFILVLFFVSFERTSPYTRYERLHILAEDGINTLSEIKVSDLKENLAVIQDLLNSGGLTQDSLNASIIEIIGLFWSMGNFTIAENITKSILKEIMPIDIGYGFYINNDLVFKSSDSKASQITTTTKIASGFQPGEVIKGFVSKAWLEKIKSKKISSYAYFGGFVGQGNLTLYIRDIPSDANIKEIYIEGSFGSNFSLYINKTFCDIFNKVATGSFPVDTWTITDKNCLDQIEPGRDNRFDINFTDFNITKKYVGGGFIRVTYETTEMTPQSVSITRQYLPGIDGIINLYDSFYVPGDLQYMKINLNFSSFENIFVNIGNTTVYLGNSSTIIDNSTLSSLLDYNFLSKKTIPLRVGHYELIETDIYVSDVILTTSLVEGMKSCDVNSPSPSNITPDCNSTISDIQNKRIDIAKYLDKIFVDIVLNNTGNKVGLQAYHSSAPSGDKFREPLTDDKSTLITEINGYDYQRGQGARCLCCAIHKSEELLTNPIFNPLFSDPSRKKYIILMSDGDAAKTTLGECPHDYTGDARQDAINEACYVKNTYNITVYTIGFGAGANNTLLQQIAACGGGEWKSSDDIEGLKEIYEYFAKKISKSIKYSLQPALPLSVNSTLFQDSYIEFEYIPETPPYSYGEISLNFETDPFGGCNTSFFVPLQLTVDDIIVTSYSSDFWTKNLFVNNSFTGYSWFNVFNLTNYSTKYITLGDPFHIKFPASYIKSNESNKLKLVLGFSPDNESLECSTMDRVIYTARFKAITSYSPPLPKATGNCVIVYYDNNYDGNPDGSVNVNVSSNNGLCINVEDLDMNNSIHYTFLELLKILNFVDSSFGLPGSKNNPIDVAITEDLIFQTTSISNVPSLWGPLRFRMDVWT